MTKPVTTLPSSGGSYVRDDKGQPVKADKAKPAQRPQKTLADKAEKLDVKEA